MTDDTRRLVEQLRFRCENVTGNAVCGSCLTCEAANELEALSTPSPAPREAVRVLVERAARILDRYDLTDQIHGLGRDVDVFVRDVAALHAQDQGDTLL